MVCRIGRTFGSDEFGDSVKFTKELPREWDTSRATLIVVDDHMTDAGSLKEYGFDPYYNKNKASDDTNDFHYSLLSPEVDEEEAERVVSELKKVISWDHEDCVSVSGKPISLESIAPDFSAQISRASAAASLHCVDDLWRDMRNQRVVGGVDRYRKARHMSKNKALAILRKLDAYTLSGFGALILLKSILRGARVGTTVLGLQGYLQEMTSTDDILTTFGPWHFWIFAFVLIRGVPSAYFSMGITFMAPSIDHWCAKPKSLGNWTTEEWRAYGIPHEDAGEGALAPSHCNMYLVEDINGSVILLKNTTVPCSSWEYDVGNYIHTLTNQFDLVCNRVWLRAASQSFYMAGLMVGSFVFAHVSDWYGRKRAIAFMIPITVAAGFISAFSSSFMMYNIGRMLSSFALGGIYNTSYTYVIECVGAKHRAVGAFISGTGWTSGLLTLVAFAWYLRNWIHLQIAISLCMLVVGALWLGIPESPRWLLAAGKHEQARHILEDAAKKNKIQGVSVDNVIAEYQEKKAQENLTEKPTFVHLFGTAHLCRTTVVVCAVSIAHTMLYYNVTYASINLGTNPYLSFAIVAAMEYPSRILAVPLVKYMRRRRAYVLTFSLAAICSAAIAFVPKESWWLQLSLAVLGKLGISCGGTVQSVQVSELYPTRMRTLALGFSISTGRVGAILSPFTNELGIIFYPWVPRAVDAATGVILVLLSVTLPETLNIELPDTLKDIKTGSNYDAVALEERDTLKKTDLT
ncbi:organic cation transporter protein-like [Ornithodoros turicata]|uniref:organic cation transporter protein-like n=1 Tax=Ornithodoros turicata TaxID=34597 RepID=UPI003138EC80